MKNINWDQFENDRETLNYLKGLPRYRNTKLKSLFWRANFFLHLVICRFFKIIKPIFIVFVTNNKCNLDCSYCYGDYGKRDHYEEYSTKKLLQMVDELKDLGTKLLTMHGGESLLRPDIGEIFNYAKLKGFYISFNTNGYAVPHRIEEIRCVDSIVISLDGSEENNDKNRGEGCFKKAVKAIDVLREEKIPVTVSATLTKEVIDDMEYLAKLAMEKKFRIQYSVLYNYNDSDQQEVTMTKKQTIDITQKIWDLKSQGYPVYYCNNVLEATINWPLNFERRFLLETDEDYQETIENNKLIPCFHGSLKYQIDADGRVVVCWAQNNPEAPNIKDLGIKEAFQQVHDNNKCRHCVFLANNEHNGLMNMSPKNVLRTLWIQISETLKINEKPRSSCGNSLKNLESTSVENLEIRKEFPQNLPLPQESDKNEAKEEEFINS